MPKETSLLAGAFGFRVSSEKMRQVRNELRLEALRHFRTQAEVLSQGVAA